MATQVISPNFMGVSTGGGTGSASTIATAAMNTFPHFLLVAGMAYGTSTTLTKSVSDTAGNVWLPCTGSYVNTQSTAGACELWYCENCIGNSANVVTATLSAADTFISIQVHQFRMARLKNSFEVAVNGNQAAGTTATTANFSPVDPNNISVCTFATAGPVAQFTPDANYHLGAQSVGASGTLDRAMEYREYCPSGSQSASITIDATDAINICVASFRGAILPTSNTGWAAPPYYRSRNKHGRTGGDDV